MINETTDNGPADLWPFTAGSKMIDQNTAREIRKWALNGVMTEAELRAHSQRQILYRYIHEHLRPILAKFCPQLNDPKVQKRAQVAAESLIRKHNGDVPAESLFNAMQEFGAAE